jgi:ABC-type sugar transport system substrate-binding protein
MKKSLVFTLLFLVSLATYALAQGQGAVRAEFDPNVGWVNLNTTADGKLIVTAHLEDGAPDLEYSVTLRVRYEDGTTDILEDVATLTTNGQGKGNANVQVDINPPAGSTTLRRVAVRVTQLPDPVYVAVAWDIPLK